MLNVKEVKVKKNKRNKGKKKEKKWKEEEDQNKQIPKCRTSVFHLDFSIQEMKRSMQAVCVFVWL